MRRYLIERDIPGLGDQTADDLRAAAQKSCAALQMLGTGIQWEYSYITGSRMYCVYLGESESIIREHAKIGGFPATKVTEVKRMIDPLTATPRG